MLATDWQSVSELHGLSEKQLRFERFVLRHLGGDSDSEQLRKARANARKSCPTGLETFCREVTAAASRGLAEQAQAANSAKDFHPDWPGRHYRVRMRRNLPFYFQEKSETLEEGRYAKGRRIGKWREGYNCYIYEDGLRRKVGSLTGSERNPRSRCESVVPF